MSRFAALTALVLTSFGTSASPEDGSCQNPIRLDAEASALREAFNSATGSTRLLFVVDPVCPACLRGAGEMSRTVMEPYGGDKRLAAYVVHLAVIGGKEGDTRRTCELLTHGQVKHFWDPTGQFGRPLAKAVDLKTSKGADVYAWDVWLLYEPRAQWEGVLPPRPIKLMHQLMALSDGSHYDFFDAEAFAKDVAKSLGRESSR